MVWTCLLSGAGVFSDCLVEHAPTKYRFKNGESSREEENELQVGEDWCGDEENSGYRDAEYAIVESEIFWFYFWFFEEIFGDEKFHDGLKEETGEKSEDEREHVQGEDHMWEV